MWKAKYAGYTTRDRYHVFAQVARFIYKRNMSDATIKKKIQRPKEIRSGRALTTKNIGWSRLMER